MKNILFLFSMLIIFFSANAGDALFENCMSCHDSDIGIYPVIDPSFFGIHRDINITDGSGNLSDGDCSVCHYDISNMFSSGFTVSTYTCEDCHVYGAIPGAPGVYNHNRNTNISVNVFCSDCHNKTANLFRYSINASAAHYGINASFGISPGEPYCIYCHRNSSTNYYDLMQNPNNDQINDHTTGILYPIHPAGRPDCTTCHGTDRLHGPGIYKPVLNSGFCISCHTSDTLQKNRHNDAVECTDCHTDVQSDIHTIKYVMQNGSYRSISATGCPDCHDFGLPAPYFRLPFLAADCPTCHQNGGLVKFASAPQITTPVKHSANPYSGALWNGSQTAYWSSQQSACDYCHGNTIHGPNALGKIENIRSGNMQGQSITNTSYWCANCHYENTSSGNYSYNASAFSPVAPEIQNNTGLVPRKASDGTPFFNHSLKGWSDDVCRTCHSSNSPTSTTQFIHNVAAGGGGADCISCHDINATGAPADKRIDFLAFNKGVHFDLNNGGNRACWACHGDGTEPGGHPADYRSPKKCSDDSCHSLNQDYRAPMVYSHFRNASLNSNPTNAPDLNITTQDNCENCHVNSVTAIGKNLISTVSHYTFLALPDSINCIYCHINEDNSILWGNATLIDRNRTALAELDRVKNKFTLKAGESIGIGPRYTLTVLEVSTDRNALIELLKDDLLVDRSPVGRGNYTYEETITIDNASIWVPVIVLNFTDFFNSGNISFVQFEGFRSKRIHSENKTTTCYLCHVYSRPKIKYRVIERVDRDIDDIYYTEEHVNFTDKNEFDESKALRVIADLTDTDKYADLRPGTRKSILEGDAWTISRDYSIQLKEITTESNEALMQFKAGNYSYEDIVKKGMYFEYTPAINYLGYQSKNVTIFRAKVSEIIQAKPKNMVVLEEVAALSPDIKRIQENQTLEGYNASWLWENSSLMVGKIPSDFHSPQLYDGNDGGGDCLSCHGIDGISEKKVISLGKHNMVNGGGNNACYTCHGGRQGIQNHPSAYRSPRECKSCHVATIDNYNAVYIGDEEHKDGLCMGCHVTDSHIIKVYEITPSVKEISIEKQDKKTIIKASASAGYKMRVRGARYYIDLPEEKFNMSPVDGIFDSQTEGILAEIDVSKMPPGKHILYVEAMERDNKWGTPASLAINNEGGELMVEGTNRPGRLVIPLIGFILILFSLGKLMKVDMGSLLNSIK